MAAGPKKRDGDDVCDGVDSRALGGSPLLALLLVGALLRLFFFLR